MLSGGKVLEMASSLTASARRPLRRQAAAIRSRTCATFSLIPFVVSFFSFQFSVFGCQSIRQLLSVIVACYLTTPTLRIAPDLPVSTRSECTAS